MHEIKSIGVLQTAKVLGAIYLALAAFFGLAIGISILLRGHPGRAIFVIFIVPILYGGGSFLVTIIMCSIYNLVAAKLGGVEIELSPAQPKQP
ncbi:MAG TPA: hypothetical protein VEC38_13935 [Candidatus Binataceae bacterium]|nr:hypothetical protein [Candidatus Binataceae bacterium]